MYYNNDVPIQCSQTKVFKIKSKLIKKILLIEKPTKKDIKNAIKNLM